MLSPELGGKHEAARLHNPARRRGSVAARGARPDLSVASDYSWTVHELTPPPDAIIDPRWLAMQFESQELQRISDHAQIALLQ